MRIGERNGKVTLLSYIARAFGHNPAERLAAERTVVLDVYKRAKARKDTRAMSAASARAYVATVMELQATVRRAR